MKFVATLLLAAVISPMADATQAIVARTTPAGMALSEHVRVEQTALLASAAEASRKSTDRSTTQSRDQSTDQSRDQSTDAATVPASRKEPALLVAQIPANNLSDAVYYDSRAAATADQAQAAPTRSDGTLAAGAMVPGKWTSLLATVLLFGFLFWRRAS